MKKYIIISLALVASLFATSCIKETFPTDVATKEQIGKSASALEASVRGIPSQLVQGYLIYGGQEYEFDMAYPGIMIMLDSAAGEIVDNGNTGYDWYSYWTCGLSCGEKSPVPYVPFRSFYMFIKSANDVISAVDPENATALQLKFLGQAYAYRAHIYLDMVRIYEPKQTTDTQNIQNYEIDSKLFGLTIPLVTEKTTVEQAKANPRATVDQVYELIFSDLDNAVKYLEGTDKPAITYPSLAVVYGLLARAYLERGSAGVDGAFAKAAEYADKAITTFGGSPLTQDQWENPQTGFNSSSANSNSWMWALQYSAETMGNLCNFVAHMSGEETWTSYGWRVGRGISRARYESIPDTDWRKHSWIDPAGRDYYNYKVNRDVFDAEGKPLNPYSNLKFRPASGDYATYKVGGASEVPLMRIEEMYLIKAEGLAMSGNLAEAKVVLNSLIQTRDVAYDCSQLKTAEIFQKEVYNQKRIELWGEGLVFFDAKRLAAGIHNGYKGTNSQSGYAFNCEGICPWWNWVIPQTEIDNNPALQGFNNPDPTTTVKEWVE